MRSWLLGLAALGGLALGPVLAPVGAGAAEGQITIATHFTLVPAWFDPAVAAGQYTATAALYAMHDALVKPMPGNGLAPSLAESWSMSPDGKWYEFVLRKGVLFHNGQPLTGEDVKFSFERYRAGASPIRTRVDRVEVVAPDRVRFVLKEAWPDFMSYYGSLVTSAGWIVPKAYVEQVGEEGFLKHPIGAGPYRFVSFTPGVELVLEAFDQYWRKPPGVKRIVLKSVPDETTRVAALKRGEVDIGYVFNGPAAEEVRDSPPLVLKATYPAAHTWLTFTEQWDRKSPWSDLRVRQAANLAIDRQAINEALYLGYGRVAASFVPKSFEFAWAPPPAMYDPAKAKALLQEAGHPGGFDAGELFTELSYSAMAEAVANDLGAVGIRVRVRPLERAAYFSQWSEKKLRGIVLGVIGTFGNAAIRLQDFVPEAGRYSYGSYPDMEALFREQATTVDPGKRGELLTRLQQLVYQRAMFAPIIQIPGLSGYGPRVAESALDLIQNYSFVAPYEELRLKSR